MEEEFKKVELEEMGWLKYFNNVTLKSREHSSDTGKNNRALNRYIDILPYDRTRIKLQRCPDTDYINANLVTVPKAARQYILTQGPLSDTASHFWLMIWEHKSSVIVMLNKCLEDFIACEQYWPNDIDAEHLYEDVGLRITLKEVDVRRHYVIRHLLLEDTQQKDEQKNQRIILQFQYTAWPDHGEPESPTSFLGFLSKIRKSGGLDKMDEPSIVHCSAGVGRSGTFCLIDSILSMIENQGSTEGIDIVNTLLEMRDCRKGLIQSPVQFRFAYMCIIYGIKILERANKLHPHMSSMAKVEINGSNGRNNKRNKKKNTNGIAPNVFNKHQLVEALDDIDSDEADDLFEGVMKHLPSLKKARNSAPNTSFMSQVYQFAKESQTNLTSENSEFSADQKAQMLAMDSLLAEKEDLQPNSVLLRRRERELKNQRVAEKTQEIKNRMKAEELNKERSDYRRAVFKKSILISGLALFVSYFAYAYLHG